MGEPRRAKQGAGRLGILVLGQKGAQEERGERLAPPVLDLPRGDPGFTQLQLGLVRTTRVDQEPSQARTGVDLEASFARLTREPAGSLDRRERAPRSAHDSIEARLEQVGLGEFAESARRLGECAEMLERAIHQP